MRETCSIYIHAWPCNNSLAHAVSNCVRTMVHSFPFGNNTAFLRTFFFTLVSHSACVLCTHYVHILDRRGDRRWWFPQKKKPRTVNTTVFLSPVPPTKALRLGHFLLGAGLGSSLRRLSHWGGRCLDPVCRACRYHGFAVSLGASSRAPWPAPSTLP